MISSARCIQARASIVRWPTVRMPVPTTTSDPALFALIAMPYPTKGNTAAAIAPRIAAETRAGVSVRCIEAGEATQCGKPGEAAQCDKPGEAAQCGKPGEATQCGKPGEAA